MLSTKNKHRAVHRTISAFLLFFFIAQIFEVQITLAASFFGDGLVQTARAAPPASPDANPPGPAAADSGTNQPTPAPPGQTASPQNHYSIIAILVEDALMQDSKTYAGLNTKYSDNLKEKTLAGRIRRYAIDAQSSQEFTKSLIIKIPAGAKVEHIAQSLERLYIQGDGTKDEINRLTGIVLVGNVPLPVVNKNGNRFASLLPYTDFEDKAYLFDAASGDYLPNPNLKFAAPEIWHGVIRPPVQGDEGIKLLTEYFDKNHLFHQGVADYATFDKKLLLADLFNEFKGMNKFQFAGYLRYLAHWADMTYLRFTKHLAEQFYDESKKKLDDNGTPIPSDQNDAAKGAFKTLPDIQSRQIIMNYIPRYVNLFEKFLANINDWSNFTGRYDATYKDANGLNKSDLQSVPALIGIKDESTRYYFKQLNDAVERKIDEYALQLQAPVSMIQKTIIKGTLVLDNDLPIQPPHDLGNEFVNLGSDLGLMFVNGDLVNNLKTAVDCVQYRGSNNGGGQNTQLASVLSTGDPLTSSNDDPGLAGCNGKNIDHPERCFPSAAKTPILDINGAKEVDPATVPPHKLDWHACFDFKEKANYETFQIDVSAYLNALNSAPDEAAKSQLPLPRPDHQSADNIVLYKPGLLASGPTITFADLLGKLGIPADDWQQIGERLLQKAQDFTFDNEPFPGVKKMNVSIVPIFANGNFGPVSLPSIIYHKEPTADGYNNPYTSLNAQVKAGGYALSLPIDNPRFVAFKDQSAIPRKIIYPDIFSAASFDDYLQSLKDKESEIQATTQANGVNTAPHFLSGIADGTTEVLDQSQKNLLKTSATKVADAFKWRDMNIDDKHTYVLEKYLGTNGEPFVEKMKSGYEALYFATKGSADHFDMQFNGDYPEEEKDPEFLNGQNPPQTDPTIDSGSGGQNGNNAAADQNASGDGIDLLSWFPAILKWIKDTTALTATAGSQSGPVCGSDDTFGIGSGGDSAALNADGQSAAGKTGAGKTGAGKKNTSNTSNAGAGSDKRKIRIITYQKTTDNSYSKSNTYGFVIKDDAGKIIAEINGKTGYIRIGDERFQLIALPSMQPAGSTAEKPVRLAVQEKSTLQIVASLFFVTDPMQPVSIDGANMNFESAWSNLVGAHIKDLVSNDAFSAEYAGSNDTDTGGVWLFKTTETKHKIGLIDPAGNIFLAKNYGLKLKENDGNGPVVFEIVDGAGRALFEVYLAAKFSNIQILPAQNDYQNFNQIDSGSADFTGAQANAGAGTDAQEQAGAIAQPLDIPQAIKTGRAQAGANPSSAPNFKDLSPEHEGFGDIIKLAKRGIIEGYGDGSFKPDQLITREEFIKLDLGSVCTKCTGFDDNLKSKISAVYDRSPFPDQNITPNLLYCVKEGKNRSIISGYGGGQKRGYFVPHQSISRAEAAKVILETARQQKTDIRFITETSAGKPWYYNYVLTAQHEHLYPSGKFQILDQAGAQDFKKWFDNELKNPGSAFINWLSSGITRAEFAIMASRLSDLTACDLSGSAGSGQNLQNNQPDQAGASNQNTKNDELTLLLRSRNNANEGAYIVGNSIFANDVYTTQTQNSSSSKKIEYSDQIPADSKSRLFVRAEVVDDQGNIDRKLTNGIIEFFNTNKADASAKIDPNVVWTKEGVAETEITSRNKSGEYLIGAELKEHNLPYAEKSVFVTPLAAAAIDLKADSAMLKTGGLAATTIHANVKDANGNLVDADPYQLTFSVDGQGKLDESKDEDTQKTGVQITTINGAADISLTTTADPGAITVKAALDPALAETPAPADPPPPAETPASPLTQIIGQTRLQSRNDLHINLKAAKPALASDFKSQTSIEATVVDANNNQVTDFNSRAQFALLQSALGQLVTNPLQDVVHGKSIAIFKTSNLAGNPTITVTINGFDPASLQLSSLPKAAKKIVLESNADSFESSPSSSLQLTAKLYDTDNNFVSNDSKTKVTFKFTASTKNFASFDAGSPGSAASKTVQVKNGVATVTLHGAGISGPVNVVATSGTLVPGSLKLKAVSRFSAEKFKDLAPNALFASLLGSDFGNILKDNYLGGWFVFSGKSESAVSLLSDPKPHLRLAGIDRNGVVSLLSQDSIAARVVPEQGDKKSRILLSDPASKTDLAEMVIILKPQQSATITLQQPTLANGENVYVQNVTEDKNYQLTRVGEDVSLSKNGTEAVRVQRSGSIKLLDNNFKIMLDDESAAQFLTLKILDQGSDVAKVFFVNNFYSDVSMADESQSAGGGVYVHLLSADKKFQFEQSFSGNSTASAKGIYLTDQAQDIDKSEAPGQSYTSLEAAPDEAGIGFVGQNKHMLLFAAGNSVGEANLPYASEIGIVLGDPTVRLNNKINISKTGFTKDIGQEIYFGDAKIKEIVPLDYNSDGLKDLFVAYEDGKIRLLQNNRGNPRFTDRGIFLNFPGGILSMAAADLNHDSQEDLIIATADSCRKGEVCIDEYENQNGNFLRKNLALKTFSDKNRIYQIRVADMNNDTWPDLVTSDDTGAIRIFYNKKGQIDPDGRLVGSLGLHINNTANLKSEVLVAYDNMPINNPDKTDDDKNFATIPVVTRSGKNPTDEQKQIDTPFIFLDADPNLLTSEKRAKDLTPPLNVLAKGDQVTYTITLKNSGKSTLKNVLLADVVPSSLTLDKNQISCLDCDSESIQVSETGQSLRPYLVSGFSIPKKKSRTIVYTGTVKDTPKIKITLGQNISKSYSPQDNFMDIAAVPENNPTGKMTIFYSLSIDKKTKEIVYGTYVSKPGPPPPAPKGSGPFGDGQPSNDTLSNTDANGIPQSVSNYLQTQNAVDDNGLPSSWDDFNSGLASIASGIQGITSALTCGAGCLPLPVNYSFLTPGPINAMGIVTGFDPGLPVFGWGFPSLIPVWPPMPYQGTLGGRIYISPTLTMGLGVGVCLGPYLAAACFTVAPPIPGLAAVCAQIAGAITDAIASANNAIQSAGNTVISAGGSAVDSDASGRSQTGGFAGSQTLGNYQYKASVNTNFRVPGFPGAITKWLEDQSNEIINKLTDLPDFYFIYPDPTSIIGSVVPTEQAEQNGSSPNKKAFELPSFSSKPFKDKDGAVRGLSIFNPSKLLSFINSIPLIQIDAREVPFKIPALSAKEIERVKADFEQWKEDEKAEVERVKALWKCGTDTRYQTICDKLLVNTDALAQSVEKNLQILEKYKQLPHKILSWKNVATKYMYQIICYLDAIIQLTGGYIKKQQGRIELWIEMIRKAKEMIQTWKALFNLIIDYQTSCDKCSSARFSLMELLLKLFAVIPSPPVIPFPKLPDIYLDISQIKTGLKVIWPDVKFMPEHLIIPKLPRIILPDLPTITLNLPQIPLLPDLPPLPDLPDLPPLPLPTLPDIPPPPKIPQFPVSLQAVIDVLKAIFKILCLLKKGLLSVPELKLKTQIESLTERPLNPLLPIDLGIKLQFPPIQYNYVDRIELKGALNLQLDFAHIYNFINDLADNWNQIATDLVKKANQTATGLGKTAQGAADAVNNAAQKAVPGNINVGPSTSALRTIVKKADPLFAGLMDKFEAASKALAADAKIYAANNSTVEKNIYLKATQKMLGRDDPLLNRPLSQVKAGIALQDLPQYEIQKKYTGLRNAFIAFADDQNTVISGNSNSPVDLADLQELGRILAGAPTLTHFLSGEPGADKPTASLNPHAQPTSSAPQNFQNQPISSATQNSQAQTKHGSSLANSLLSLAQDFQKQSRQKLHLLADANLPKVPSTPGASLTPIPKGIYIYNQDLQVNERLINDTDEADQPSQLAFLDVDNDGDEDIIYSYGGNIYLKQNYKKSPVHTYYGGEPQLQNLSELLPPAPAIDNFEALTGDHKRVQLSWTASAASDVIGYLVTYNLMPDALQQNGALAGNFSPSQKVAAILEKPLDAVALDAQAIGSQTGATSPGPPFMVAQNVFNDVFVDDPKNKIDHQQLANNTPLNFGTTLISENGGSATVNFADGSYLRLDKGQTLQLKKLDLVDSPQLDLSLTDGFYYAQIQSFNAQGFSTPSFISLMAPTSCGDKIAPTASGGPSERSVPIFKTLIIDASKSFDPNGEISQYFIDTDPAVDSNNDGDTTNDPDLAPQNSGADQQSASPQPDANSQSAATFLLGPYQEIHDHEVVLNVLDSALNSGQQKITIHVTVPKITLDSEVATSGKITGQIDPADDNVPITVIRDRAGVKTALVTKSATDKGKYLTDKSGKFQIPDLNLQDTIVIRNENGDIIGQINPKTGRISLSDDRYHLEVLPADFPVLPTRLLVKRNADNFIIATLFLVTDANTDTVIDPPDLPYDTARVAAFKGVHIKDDITSDNYIFRKVPGDDSDYPGGTEIVDAATQKRLAVVDTGGNFYIFDSRLSLRLKAAANLADPLVIEIVDTPSDTSAAPGASDTFDASIQPRVIGEFNISVRTPGIHILPQDKFKALIEGIKKPLPYKDVNENHPYYQDILNLYQRHILDDLPGGKTQNFGPDDPILRSEFSDIMLKIFCIIPRREAYEGPSAFTDIPFTPGSLPWFYAVVKEAYFRGFITGYKAEIDRLTGKTPFKPDAPISKAEAVKIILEALQQKGVINMGQIPLTEPYYLPYLQIARDLTPYLRDRSGLKSTYILTDAEAGNPSAPINRGMFIAMADRVLGAYDCSAIDTDKDGMPDFWEQKNGLNPFSSADANLDPDGDGLKNIDEFKFKTDPRNPDTDGDGLTDGDEVNKYHTDPRSPDTDGGGINDGVEVGRGTDPLTKKDDYYDPRRDLKEGIYVIEQPCSSCPCISSIDHTADLLPGDKIFAILANDTNAKIFSKSNEVEIVQVKK